MEQQAAQYAKRSKIMSITMQTVVNPDPMVLNLHSKLILFISTLALVKMLKVVPCHLFSGVLLPRRGRCLGSHQIEGKQEAAALVEAAFD